MISMAKTVELVWHKPQSSTLNQLAGALSAARKRLALLARAFMTSTSRSRGGALVTSDSRSSCAAWATWSTARLNASSFVFEGLVKPLSATRKNGTDAGLERIKRAIEVQRDKPVGYVVLDFSSVPGLDTSAVLSLVKLRNYCEEHGVTLGFSGLSESMRVSFERADFFGITRAHQVFGSRNEAIEWCEDMLLMHHEVGAASTHSFESWLESELGSKVDFARIAPYLERQELSNGEFLFQQGEPSDSVVLQASGCVAIMIIDELGRPIRLRRMIGHTVVGEMGFYRGMPRTASVVAEGPTVIYRLTQAAFDKMQDEDPTAAAALHKLIIRLLSDRLEFANREISALL